MLGVLSQRARGLAPGLGRRAERRPPEPLRLLVASTPKTGNTWVRELLACLYDLSFVGAAWPFHPDQPALRAERWITQHHYFPTEDVLRWAADRRIVLVTTIRHPADVLVSMYHHVQRFAPGAVDQRVLRRMLHEDFERTDIVPERLNRPFSHDLECSIEWLRSGASLVVRYEDLRRDPVPTLQRLTERIRPVPTEAIERAIAQCEIGLLRRVTGGSDRFYRRGAVGEWREVLAPEVVDDLRRTAPYPSQLAALGYSLDREAPAADRPAAAPTLANPFADATRFDNGAAVAPLLVRLFFSVPSSVSARWHPVGRTDRGSFYAWANAPGDDAPPRGASPPIVLSRLALYAYRNRIDLREAFPEISGRDRPDFADWFIRHATADFGLDPAFVAPVRASFVAWGGAPAAEDPALVRGRLPKGVPLISAYAFWLFMYRRRDLQEAFPKAFGEHRRDFAEWFVRHGVPDLNLDPALVAPVEASLAPRPSRRRPGRGRSETVS